MKMPRRIALVILLLVCAAAVAAGQGSTVSSSQAAAFMGTWTFAMTNPPNSEQAVRIWDKNGMVGASLQIGKSPPTDITGIFKDGDVLVLTTTLRENGVPIWAVIALTLDGQTMNMAQMLQQSQTIKRGSGKRQG
jgi:ABC-type glycerol-3-phosphate transport system substrate-binding protein